MCDTRDHNSTPEILAFLIYKFEREVQKLVFNARSNL